jgi:methyltransferase family protein
MVHGSTGMDEAEIARKKQLVVQQYGPWGCNIHLVGSLFTKEPDAVGVVNERIHRVVRLVADHAGKPLNELRILDLAAYEGAFAIEFARHGADVVMIEARDPHVAKARFVKDVLGLDNLQVIKADVRSLDDTHGTFDVVLCLGILYHLDAPELIPFLSAVYALTRHLVVLETQMSLRARLKLKGPADSYWGRYFGENVQQLGAAIDSSRALWLTKPSLLNLLRDIGFTSVLQCLNPPIHAVDVFIDHGTFLAVKGEQQQIFSAPPAARSVWESSRWHQHTRPMNEPRQRLATLIQERIARVFGRSIYDKLFRPAR